jgi:hypothetical protein
LLYSFPFFLPFCLSLSLSLHCLCLLIIPLFIPTWYWLRRAIFHYLCGSIWNLPAWTNLDRGNTYQHGFTVVSITTPGVMGERETSQRPSKQKSHVVCQTPSTVAYYRTLLIECQTNTTHLDPMSVVFK